MSDPRSTELLLGENETLRRALADTQHEKGIFAQQLDGVRQDLQSFRGRQAELERRLHDLEAENQALSDQYFALDEQIAGLAHLYVAVCRLHESTTVEDVLGAVREVLANLVGTEEIAIFERRATGTTLTLLASVGIDAEEYRSVTVGDGVIGRASAGDWYLPTSVDDARPAAPASPVTACIPLTLGSRVVGAIAIFRLLPQKRGLRDIDRDVFQLLATHAALALERTRPSRESTKEDRG